MAEWSDNLAVKAVHYENGKSEWSFDSSMARARVGWSVARRRTIHSTRAINRGEIVFFEYPCVYVSCGRYRNRICCWCNAIGLKRVVVDENCASLSFCSRECLNNASSYIDICAPMFQAIDKMPSDSQQDQCRLVLNLLHARKFRNRNAFAEVLQMERHESVPAIHTNRTASEFYRLAVLNAGDLLVSSDTEDVFCNIFRAVMYNSQSLSIPSLPGTSLLCLLSTMSRINHSCDPNVQVTCAVGKGGLRAALVSTRNIDRNEELCMTYISALHLRFRERRCILEEAFAFICECNRCQVEAKNPHSYSVECDMNQMHLFRNPLPAVITSKFLVTAASIVSCISDATYIHILSCSAIKGNTSLYDVHDILSSLIGVLKDPKASSNIAPEESPRFLILLCRAITTVMKCFSCEFTMERLQILMFGIKLAGTSGVFRFHDSLYSECVQYLLTESEIHIRFHELAAEVNSDSSKHQTQTDFVRSIVTPFREAVETARALC